MIELLNIDCMEYMVTCEDNAFDLAIVDPPYGIGEAAGQEQSRNQSRGRAQTAVKYTVKQWDKEPPSIEYITELQRISKNQIIWGANHFMQNIALGSSCWVVWDKVNGESDFADCELAWTSFKSAVRLFRFQWAGMLQGDMKNKEQRIHPTQKPVKLYDWLLTNYAEPGQRILDTHLGSGSSAIAAHYFGCDFVGCELDPDYYKAAKERFDLATAQEALF
jgi:site-specific DNA-methyltransferase (adenine-specific)